MFKELWKEMPTGVKILYVAQLVVYAALGIGILVGVWALVKWVIF